MQKVREGKIMPVLPAEVAMPDELRELINSCISYEPDARPTFATIRKKLGPLVDEALKLEKSGRKKQRDTAVSKRKDEIKHNEKRDSKGKQEEAEVLVTV